MANTGKTRFHPHLHMAKHPILNTDTVTADAHLYNTFNVLNNTEVFKSYDSPL